MKISITCLLCLFLFSLLYLDCNKKGSTPVSNMTLLTQSSWRYDTAGTGNDSSGVIINPLPPGTVKDCERDNIFTFHTDGTAIDDEGATKCDSAGLQTTSFTWSFNTGQNTIISSDSLFAGFGGNIAITSLTSTQLHLLKVIPVLGFPVIVDIYLKH